MLENKWQTTHTDDDGQKMKSWTPMMYKYRKGHDDSIFVQIEQLHKKLAKMTKRNANAGLPGIYTNMNKDSEAFGTKPEREQSMIVRLSLKHLIQDYDFCDSETADKSHELVEKMQAAATLMETHQQEAWPEAKLKDAHRDDMEIVKNLMMAYMWECTAVDTDAMAKKNDKWVTECMEILVEQQERNREDDEGDDPGKKAYKLPAEGSGDDSDEDMEGDGGDDDDDGEGDDDEPRETKASKKRTDKVQRQLQHMYADTDKAVQSFGVDDQGRQAEGASEALLGLQQYESNEVNILKEKLKVHRESLVAARNLHNAGHTLDATAVSKMIFERRCFDNQGKNFIPEVLSQDQIFQRPLNKHHLQTLKLLHLKDPCHVLNTMAVVYTGEMEDLYAANTDAAARWVALPKMTASQKTAMADYRYSGMAGKFLVMGGQHGLQAFKLAKEENPSKMSVVEFLTGTLVAISPVSTYACALAKYLISGQHIHNNIFAFSSSLQTACHNFAAHIGCRVFRFSE